MNQAFSRAILTEMVIPDVFKTLPRAKIKINRFFSYNLQESVSNLGGMH